MTIKHKTFKLLSSYELETFTSQELQKAIWIAQGNKTPFDKRKRQYSNNIEAWIYDGLMTHEKRNEFKLTKWGNHYAKLNSKEGSKYIKECNKKNKEIKSKEKAERESISKRAIEIHLRRQSYLNKVDDKDCVNAIEYFYSEGFRNQLRNDERHYVTILLKKVANSLDIRLR
jgi:hypothetical protein|tara:strand:+ start:1649 stop:2164 length:516 start_codon:yes stop_codon:yes gene_type:complete